MVAIPSIGSSARIRIAAGDPSYRTVRGILAAGVAAAPRADVITRQIPGMTRRLGW